jgi:hypothetical protein
MAIFILARRSFSCTNSKPTRFGMTPVPSTGGNPGALEERQAQWFLELSFFRDLVYRNPLGKGGKGELADAVVLHDDSALLVHVKAQSTTHSATKWAEKHVRRALKQLRGTRRMLMEGHVSRLRSATLGEVPFLGDRYTQHYGIIILGHASEPFCAEEIVPELALQDFPIHVFSLEDFRRVTTFFDTAGDLIMYLDARHDLRDSIPRRVHAEETTLVAIANRFENLLLAYEPEMSADVLERTVRAFRAKASGQLRTTGSSLTTSSAACTTKIRPSPTTREWIRRACFGLSSNSACIRESGGSSLENGC